MGLPDSIAEQLTQASLGVSNRHPFNYGQEGSPTLLCMLVCYYP